MKKIASIVGLIVLLAALIIIGMELMRLWS